MEAETDKFEEYDELSCHIKVFVENCKAKPSQPKKSLVSSLKSSSLVNKDHPMLKDKINEYKSLLAVQETGLKAITEECLTNKETYIIEGKMIEMRLVSCIKHNEMVLKDVGRKLRESKELADAVNKQVKEYECTMKCLAELGKIEEAESS